MRAIALAAVALAMAAVAPARAEFPERPPRLVVGFAPGGLSDIISRLLADTIAARSGQRIVVENRTGAGGMIAFEAVARSAADGYTVLSCGSGPMTVSPELPGLELPIDIAGDIAPVANVVKNNLALAVPADSPHRTVGELLAAARANPGALNYGSAGIGSLQQLAVEWLKREAAVDLVPVVYRGTGPAVLDLIAGRIHLILTSLGDVSRQVQAGQLRLLAIADEVGTPLFPDAPRIADTVPGFSLMGWAGLCGPRGMAKEALDWWQSAVAQALEDPQMRQRVEELGMIPGYESAEEFGRTIEAGRSRWREVIRAAGIRAE